MSDKAKANKFKLLTESEQKELGSSFTTFRVGGEGLQSKLVIVIQRLAAWMCGLIVKGDDEPLTFEEIDAKQIEDADKKRIKALQEEIVKVAVASGYKEKSARPIVSKALTAQGFRQRAPRDDENPNKWTVEGAMKSARMAFINLVADFMPEASNEDFFKDVEKLCAAMREGKIHVTKTGIEAIVTAKADKVAKASEKRAAKSAKDTTPSNVVPIVPVAPTAPNVVPAIAQAA